MSEMASIFASSASSASSPESIFCTDTISAARLSCASCLRDGLSASRSACAARPGAVIGSLRTWRQRSWRVRSSTMGGWSSALSCSAHCWRMVKASPRSWFLSGCLHSTPTAAAAPSRAFSKSGPGLLPLPLSAAVRFRRGPCAVGGRAMRIVSRCSEEATFPSGSGTPHTSAWSASMRLTMSAPTVFTRNLSTCWTASAERSAEPLRKTTKLWYSATNFTWRASRFPRV
mmetsp:Transcript_21307/g.51353  ORF Transcript_21307/g.51353 Transcript_21307/m.51353 type:complete len:230 (+) Transcript_21307:111-800(+)